MAARDARALCSIVWEKPALLGHQVTMMLEGHELPVPPRLHHATPLPCLTPGTTAHPVIQIPSLSRTSQPSTNSEVPKFPGLGSEAPAAVSCIASQCILAAPSPLTPTLLHAPLGCAFPSRGADVPNFVPLGLQGFDSQGAGGPGTGRDLSVPSPAWPLPEMYGRCGRPYTAVLALDPLYIWHHLSNTSCTWPCLPQCSPL